MARNVSPFAALTNEEKQIKWLEYQSIRLPYTAGNVDLQPEQAIQENVAKPENPSAEQINRPLPPPEVYASQAQQPPTQRQGEAALRPSALNPANLHQKTRHQQYDAVIARMKQAEKKTGHYYSWSK